ncbi:hypothetical protein SCAR479_10872 [Seiridium cardinale]|uniref:Uncharacterized protein n=1 Tax=Seiridium cardinale TaxID=138064 RepID=A0ABR2XFC9_9PEZI
MMAEGDPSTLLESFIRHVQALAQDDSYQYLKGVLEENSTLKERNHILNITNDENHRTISKLQQQLDDSAKHGEEQTEEIATLNHDKSLLGEKVALLESDAETTKAQLNENADEISRLQGDLSEKNTELENTNAELESTKTQLDESKDECSKLQADVNFRDSEIEGLKVSLDEEKSALAASQAAHEETTKELQATREDLEAKNTRLGELNALSFKMKSPPQEQTHQQLHSMFTMAYKWAENLFVDDLEESAFVTPSSGTIWAKIRNHGRVNRIIPLPLSNTREAKQMRISAVLAILAWSLAQYIFQPTYLLQCNELSDLLAGLADDDPVRENYLRSVLLPVLPSKQKANGKKRIEQVVVEVYAAVSPVLPNGRHEEFRSSLESICKQVCGQWMRLQLLDEKIEPSFDAYDDEDWKLLSLPAFDGNDTETAAAEAGTVADDAATESAIAEDDRYQGVGDIEDIAAVLWPSFLSFRGGESELLTEGFVLNKAQVKPAYNEEKAALLQGIHRAARQISRKDRTKSFVTNGEDMGVVKSFLPTESDEQSVPGSSDEPPPEPNASENGQENGESG